MHNDPDKMTRWRDSPQKKEQEKVMSRDLINTDSRKISEPEYKTITIRILAGIHKSIEDSRESFTSEIKELKTSQAKIKATINRDAEPNGCNDKEDGQSR